MKRSENVLIEPPAVIFLIWLPGGSSRRYRAVAEQPAMSWLLSIRPDLV